MRQFPLSYDTMTENKYLNAGHFLGQLILIRSIFPKPLIQVEDCARMTDVAPLSLQKLKMNF